jgi:hypothetical protein
MRAVHTTRHGAALFVHALALLALPDATAPPQIAILLNAPKNSPPA